VTPRVVLDTNVLVSGLGWRGAPAAIVDAVHAGRLTLITSPALLAELERVLGYPKLARVFGDTQPIVDLVAASSRVVIPQHRLRLLDDETDNRVLEAAIAGEAAAVVTGDREMLALGDVEGIPILTVAAFHGRLPQG
jgi:putative PIN family toxin of toxin-antitoxin system